MHLLDLHAHYPMHTPFPPADTHDPFMWLKKPLMEAANRWFNYENGVPRMAPDRVRQGSFSGFASVLYDTEDEFLVRRRDPRPQAFVHLKAQAQHVETEAQSIGIAIARTASDVDRYLNSGDRFLFHCMEGGFGCGGDPANVKALAQLGVAYMILGHLTYRGIATCPNSIPHLPNVLFHLLNPQNPREGLTPLGWRLAREAIRHGIIVDVTHCSDLAQDEIFDLAASYRPYVPVIASHTGVRSIGPYEVNLRENAVRRIADLGGIVGVIAYPYWLQPSGADTGSVSLMIATIERIAWLTGGYDHVGIGSDMDGFIKPVHECPNYSAIGEIETAVRHYYSQPIAEKILWGNALRVLHSAWGVTHR
jgi:microsomal dipeptidase-like Zn-dependent dipeptidase